MKKTNIIASLLCMAALASCGKEEAATVPAPDGTRTAIVPTAGLSISAAPSVRAALPGGPVTAFPESTEKLFAVTAYKGTAAPSSDYSNAYFDNEAVNSDADGKLSFTNTQYYPADAEKLYFYAYSPIVGASNYTAGTASAAPAVAWTIDGTQDIMYVSAVDGIGKVSAGTTQPQPEFNFGHKLKKIDFKLIQGTGFSEGVRATSVKLTNCRTQASLNLITGALTFTGNADQSIGLSSDEGYLIVPSAQANDAAPIGCVMCQAGETKLDIEVVAQGITYKTSVTLESNKEGVAAGAAGVSHLVTLTFIGTQILPTAKIVDWEDAGETSGTIE
ncbi:fimbrillin family protein [uncultured Alistipes sp.]|jgi:hypothetical protein|uniref:fimbrillin family protein n=1 Tax=uncultured Alistipes sp. TaxID=538949 RepID=UPI0026017239|nr:fimbrillin family protein [uncultured Alistipes sp.]